ncbi:MAG: PaaI family thioesterase [Lachnospiraceae bacterium]|nr:PaaI family thioesterase [Lachnospiraceae bacterium]
METQLLRDAKACVENSPFGKILRIEILDVKEGYVKARMPFLPEFQNSHGDCHGGALYAFADQCGGIAAQTHGCIVTAISGNMQYMRAGRGTEYVSCEAKTVKPGKRITVEEVSVFDDKGNLLDIGNFTYFVVKDN